jgi:hypothetical protein
VIERFMKKVLFGAILVVMNLASVVYALNVLDQKGSVYMANEYVPDRLIEVPYPVAANAKCGQWWQLMHDLGWSHKDIVKGDAIIFRESRCDPSQINAQDPTTIGKHKGSFGLYQINLYWIQKTQWYPQGFLQTKMQRELVPTDLLNPQINLASALEIIKQNRADGGCGFSAWKGC